MPLSKHAAVRAANRAMDERRKKKDEEKEKRQAKAQMRLN
jgi:hypothetical protein